jgi:predicted glycosyltransferase
VSRVLFHVQHLLGIGHQRRAAALVRALQAAGLEVTLLSGGMPVESSDLGGARLVQLPPARALDAGFKVIVDADGAPLDADFKARRRALVLAAFAEARPQVVLIETFPFGRRAFRFELDPLIAAAQAARPRPPILCSIRDVLVTKRDAKRAAEIVARVRRDFDLVLVHGDPAFVPLEASFAAAAEIADKLCYTGYVGEASGATAADEAGEGPVIVSAGGGAVGEPLLSAALAARPQTALADHPWLLLAGPNLPDPAYAGLAKVLPPGVVLERHRSDFPALLHRTALSISQGGYNTILDLLAARCRAVVVPFAAGAESEQRLRAELLAARGVITLLAETALDGPPPDRVPGAGLAAAIAGALTRAPARLAIARDGAPRSAALIAELAAKKNVHALSSVTWPGYTPRP